MRKLNVNDFYNLGNQCVQLQKRIAEVKNETRLGDFVFDLNWTRRSFDEVIKEPCPLTSSSARAAVRVTAAIARLVPESLEELVKIDFNKMVREWELQPVSSAISDFETVLRNDMPEMSTFAVGQIGIFRTDDLIDGAYKQIPASHRAALKPSAMADINEAGRCLAFRLSTAAAFHLCRAIETGLDQYHEALVGSPYPTSAGGGNNNWGARIKLLQEHHAEVKITEYLTHIKKQYRNPITHPEISLEQEEAIGFFNASVSAISMMVAATTESIQKRSTPLLPGLTPLPGIDEGDTQSLAIVD